MIPFRIMGAAVAFQRVLLIPFAIVSIGGLMFFMRRFRLGRALRAVAQDPEAASLQGININRMTALALAISGAYAGLAGGLMSPISVSVMAFVLAIRPQGLMGRVVA